MNTHMQHIEELIPDKIYCSRADFVDALLKCGISASLPHAYRMAEQLKWIHLPGGKRKVIPRQALLDFFAQHS